MNYKRTVKGVTHIHLNKTIIDTIQEVFTTILKNKLDKLIPLEYDEKLGSYITK